MKNLANLKAGCILARGLTKANPGNQHFARDYELIQRKVEAIERVLFCDTQEPK